MNETAERTLEVRRLRKRSRHFLALILLSTAGLTACSNADESTIADKFEASELHFLGSFCEGPYFAVRDGNYILFDGTKYKTLLKNITITAIGPDRLSMSSPVGSGNLVTTYLIKHDDTVAIIESIAREPEPTPEQWATAAGIQFREGIEEAGKMGPLVLCPASTTQKKTEDLHFVANEM
ncbi:hypothetical protein FHS26_005557 [Rhizobium pisi]|uniref:Uncharacterized protein n=1 Tax=Rhizobium pisi TaxID=574561 RepID=A0A3R9ABU1_9HYPH|nr:hypothetical protein [Rhizobium pisi]MBB3137789.1 hypothetical protein [Rhizobium pisi]RSB65944.1 hypothetical protein EFD55_26060 [Rhizobium pisi]TCA47691.1 hypothetical protein E0J16_27410 [Rhizobium pisi]